MPAGYRKEGSGAAFWLIIIFLAIAIGIGLWFFLKRQEKPAQTTPTGSVQHYAPPTPGVPRLVV